MKKTAICDFYIKGICKHMDNPILCSYAHGENDIVVPECKYGIKCYNFKHYYHDDYINENKQLEINICEIIKMDNRKNKKKK